KNHTGLGLRTTNNIHIMVINSSVSPSVLYGRKHYEIKLFLSGISKFIALY
ncbi:hypothetical protein L9F63_021976, partial [Diploptera punctata]